MGWKYIVIKTFEDMLKVKDELNPYRNRVPLIPNHNHNKEE